MTVFTGIIEEVGEVVSVEALSAAAPASPAAGHRLTVASRRIASTAARGDSVTVNGCCLTVSGVIGDAFVVDVTPVTLARTTLAQLGSGDAVNLESSLRAGDRLGGHVVTGHVDGVGVITGLAEEGASRRVRIVAPPELAGLTAPRGSVAVDGISLTVVDDFGEGTFTVSLIPVTLSATTAGAWRLGGMVNLEADVLARYVQRSVAAWFARERGGQRRSPEV